MLFDCQNVIDKAPRATPDKVVNTPTYKTRRATFALNKKKLTKNLKKDATINPYDIVRNNFDENLNIKCSSGFFLDVICPGFLSLAMQSSNASNPLKTLSKNHTKSPNRTDQRAGS